MHESFPKQLRMGSAGIDIKHLNRGKMWHENSRHGNKQSTGTT